MLPFKEESEFIPFIHTEDISIHEKISSATNDVVLYIATLNIYNLSFPLKKMPRGRYSIFGATKWDSGRGSFFSFSSSFFCVSQGRLYARLPVAVAMAESGMDASTVTTSVSRNLTGRTGNHHRTSVRSRNSRASGMRSG